MNKIKQLWHSLPDGVRRVLHTAWQVALGAFLAYFTAHSGDISTVGIWTFLYSALLAGVKAGLVSAKGAKS